MKLIIFLVFVALITFAPVQSAEKSVTCSFYTEDDGIYSCSIREENKLPDDDSFTIKFLGFHSPGKTNANVQLVRVFFADIPFIIAETFTQFPNVKQFEVTAAGLSRIQPGAFKNAKNLKRIELNSNFALTNLGPNVFLGAQNVQELIILVSRIDTIDVNAFNGLSKLRVLDLTGNVINRVSAATLQPLPLLEKAVFFYNELQTVDGNLFVNNPLVSDVDIGRNSIKAIGKDFLNNLKQLKYLKATENLCVDHEWTIGSSSTIEDIRQGLATCFANSA